MPVRPDPFDDPIGYLALRWDRWPREGGRSYLLRMLDEARDYVSRRQALEPAVDAFLALRASRARADGPPERRRRGRPSGEVALEAAFARTMARWAHQHLPELLEPLEVMALAVEAGIQTVPRPFDRRASETNRRDQRELCKGRWRAAWRLARTRGRRQIP